jgi:serine-aspartate repeat-containing protein C/D/E
VWNDENGNGIQDDGEAGIAGVVVELRDKDGVLIARTTTDSNGLYRFENVAPGTYTVTFKAPSGFDFTDPGRGDDPTRDSKVTNFGTGSTNLFTVLPGQNIDNIDAGLKRSVPLWEGNKGQRAGL